MQVEVMVGFRVSPVNNSLQTVSLSSSVLDSDTNAFGSEKGGSPTPLPSSLSFGKPCDNDLVGVLTSLPR